MEQNFNPGLALIGLSVTGPRSFTKLLFFFGGREGRVNSFAAYAYGRRILPFGIFYCFKAQEQRKLRRLNTHRPQMNHPFFIIIIIIIIIIVFLIVPLE